MRKLIIAILGIVVSFFCATAEVQTGVIKTRGRLQSDGSVIRGKQLPGVAVVLTNGANSTVSDVDGTFSVTVPSGKFYLKKVVKKDYQVVDPDVLSKSYEYQRNPLVIVMESLRQIEADKLAYTRQIRRTLDRDIERKQQEIEELMQSNKITEEKYLSALRKLNEYVDNNERLVAEMAERYAKIDYDSIDDFQRRVAAYILAGELTKADSLINTRGSLESRGAEIDRIREANAQRKEEIAREQDNLDKSEALAAKMLEAFGADCNSKAELFAMRHENDSAAYYLRLRADKDPHNVGWNNDAGLFIYEYLADYDLALQYYDQALDEATLLKNNEIIATELNNIGVAYKSKGEFKQALDYYIRALGIRVKTLGLEHPDVAITLNNIGGVYCDYGESAQALEYLTRALEIQEKTLGSEHPDVAASLNNIGAVCMNQGEYTKALEYHQRASKIWEKVLGAEHLYVAASLNNIGSVFFKQGEYTKALEYCMRALEIEKKSLGLEHPDVAMSLNNIATIYCDQKEYTKALNNYKLALLIGKKLLGPEHPNVATMYNNIGLVYHYRHEYTKALDYYLTALAIWKKTGHPGVVTVLNNIAEIYEAMGDKDKAASFRQGAESIQNKFNK